jgi:hypothetical protein
MARSVVTRTLPPLGKICRPFNGFAPGENRSARVLTALRTAIQKLRPTRWQPFYTMRAVAIHFGVSVPTVSEAYRRLANEGLLVVSRGSMTTIRPAGRKTPRARLTGVVAMPVWTPGFLVQGDYRTFHIECQREFQRHDMAGLPVFFQQEEELTPEFARQICRMMPDAVLWRTPAPSDRQTLLAIADSGTRVITILDIACDLPGASYKVTESNAKRQLFKSWSQTGIRRIIIPLGKRHQVTDETELESAARESGLEVTFLERKPDAMPADTFAQLEKLMAAPDTGLVFMNRPYCWALRLQIPPGLAAFLATRRTLLLGEVEAPFFHHDIYWSDRIMLNWRAIARRVTADIAGGTLPSPRQPVVFEAQWEPGTSSPP